MQLATQSDAPPIPVQWAARLLERMQLLYGAAFTRQWEGMDTDSMVTCWAEELAGYTGEEIKRGLAGCRSLKFPPTLPEFMTLCRAPIAPDAAFHEAVAGMVQRERGETGAWSHPAIYWAAVRIGRGDLMSLSYGILKNRWEGALRECLAAGSWADVPPPAPALPPPGATRTTREDAAKRIDELGAAGLVKRPAHGDHRRWARVLLERKGRGERVTAIAEAKARAVLGELA